MTNPPRPRSPLWIVVLALACEEPMHPYRMQTLIKQRGKDQIANVAQRNSVYQTIDALRRAGLIAARETSREERRPERTTYEATAEGRAALRSWVRSGLATPAREFPEFPAALSTLYGVTSPDDLRGLLEARIAALEARRDLEPSLPPIPRVFLLEGEYAAAMVRAEVKWLRAIAAELRDGELGFPTLAELRAIATTAGGPSEVAIRKITAELGLGAGEPPVAQRAPRRAAKKAATGRRKKR
jgi:DNA-binding PadR family transcriptional regulator